MKMKSTTDIITKVVYSSGRHGWFRSNKGTNINLLATRLRAYRDFKYAKVYAYIKPSKSVGAQVGYIGHNYLNYEG